MRMHSGIFRRCGVVLLAFGSINVAMAVDGIVGSWAGLTAGAVAILAGIAVLTGNPRAAAWVHAGTVFLFAAGVVVVLVVPLFQPLDLSLAQIRLDQADAAANAWQIASVLTVLLWVTRELGRGPVLDSIIDAGVRRLDARMAARAGGGVAVVAGALLWLTLHGQSAELAEQLALRQLGPNYQYHLSWISSADNGHGLSVSATVTAWNAREIKTVLIRWESR
jgi:hypothetical protein